MTAEPPHVAAHEISLLVDLIAKRCRDPEAATDTLRNAVTVHEGKTELGKELRKRGWLSSDN